VIDPVTYIPRTDLSPSGRPWPRGFRSGNGGNIEHSAGNKWQGLADPPIERKPLDGSRPRFARFRAAVWGLRALLMLLIAYADRHGARTIAAIIARWAPGHENNVEAYVAHVSKLTGFGPLEELDLHDWDTGLAVAKAIVRHELGNPALFGHPVANWYPDDVWDDAATRAGLVRRKPKPVTKDTDLVAGGGAAVLAGVSAADGLGLVKQYVEPGSVAAQVVGVLAVIAVVYLIVRRLKQRKREAT
jgi:hypothetical protein